jgi:hypothetical protein
VKKKKIVKRLLDSQNSIVKKKSSCERLRDSRNSIVKEEKVVKGLCDSHRLRKSLKSHHQKGFPPKGLRQQQVVA